MNSITVIIRGQLRTWNFCKQRMFHVFESRYTNIHWCFCTWKDSINDVTKESLYRDFENKNATIKILDRDETSNNSWNSQRRLGYELINIVDENSCIFETRPDVYLDMLDGVSFPTISNKLFTTGLNNREELCRENGKYVRRNKTIINDWFYIQDFNTFKLLTNAYVEPMKLEGQRAQLVDVTIRNNIQIEDISNIITPRIIRPTYTPNTLFGHEKVWMGMTSKEKIKLLESLNISVQDYKTNNRFISV